MRGSRVLTQEAVIRWLGCWLSPRRKLLSCPERRPSLPNSPAPVLGDVCTIRTAVRVALRTAPGKRLQDTGVRLRAVWDRLCRAPWLRSWATCLLAAPGSVFCLRRLDESDCKTRGTGLTRCGYKPCRESGGCGPLVRELLILETGDCPVRSTGRPSRTAPLRSWAMCVLAALGAGRTSVGSAISIAGNVCPSTGSVGPASRAPRLRSCATCVLAAPGSGSRLGRLDESDRKTRMTGHTRCGYQPCREGCVPFARELAVPERRPSFPNAKTPVLGDVYASRARVRIPFRADWGQRSHDTVVRPRAACVAAVF